MGFSSILLPMGHLYKPSNNFLSLFITLYIIRAFKGFAKCIKVPQYKVCPLMVMVGEK